MATLTKIIRQGNSQALRIPAAFRLPSKEVEIYRNGYGLVIIDPAEREKALAALRGLKEMPRLRKKANHAE
jgi:virulence-associated protein VagC